MNEKPEYVYISKKELDAVSALPDNPFDPGDFNEELIPGYWFARYDEIEDDEWDWAELHDQYLVIKAAAYNASNQIILNPLAG